MHRFFPDIFQSSAIKDQPTLQQNKEVIDDYRMFSDVTNSMTTKDEIKHSIKKIGTG